jgi:hypothetical protein
MQRIEDISDQAYATEADAIAAALALEEDCRRDPRCRSRRLRPLRMVRRTHRRFAATYSLSDGGWIVVIRPTILGTCT